MTEHDDLYNIPHFEFKAINQLVDAHQKIYGPNLRAVVAFGSLLTEGDTYDVDLLEVVEGWNKADRVVEFGSSDKLPLRGKLRLYFLTPEEFAHPEAIADEAMRDWVSRLLDRVRAGYLIVLQSPPLFADRALLPALNISTLTAPGSGVIQMSDPFSPPRPGR